MRTSIYKFLFKGKQNLLSKGIALCSWEAGRGPEYEPPSYGQFLSDNESFKLKVVGLKPKMFVSVIIFIVLPTGLMFLFIKCKW